MKSTLIDAGPLIALFDKNDQYHKKSLNFMKSFKGTLLSTWPVVTEVSHMLDFSVIAQIYFLKWVQRGGMRLFELESNYVDRIIELSESYSDVPMDLADASLIVASEASNIKEIISIDSDFYIYRNIRNEYLTNIFS
jgi:hypothetical protein